jgi:integrase
MPTTPTAKREARVQNLKAFFDPYRLSQISLVLIEKYKRERKAAKKADANINRELPYWGISSMRRLIFNLRSRTRFRIVSKLDDGSYRTQQVRLHKEKGRERYLSQDEAQSSSTNARRNGYALSSCQPFIRVSIVRAKIASLTNIDPEYKSATVENSYAKNGETRTVPLSDDLMKAFAELNEEERSKPEDLPFPAQSQTALGLAGRL